MSDFETIDITITDEIGRGKFQEIQKYLFGGRSIRIKHFTVSNESLIVELTLAIERSHLGKNTLATFLDHFFPGLQCPPFATSCAGNGGIKEYYFTPASEKCNPDKKFVSIDKVQMCSHVISDESQTIESLEALLEIYVDGEYFEEAAKVRDEIARRKNTNGISSDYLYTGEANDD